MLWYNNLYTGDGKRSVYNSLIRKIRLGKLQSEGVLVTLASNGIDYFDIYPAWVLLQPFYKKQDLKVVGVARSREEAIEVVRRIVQEVYDATGRVDVRRYFSEEAFHL